MVYASNALTVFIHRLFIDDEQLLKISDAPEENAKSM